MASSSVELPSKSRATLEVARQAVHISSVVKWFHARREVGGRRAEPRHGGQGDENSSTVSRCRHGGAARRYGIARCLPHGGMDGWRARERSRNCSPFVG